MDTLEEHLTWCKRRALEYLDRGDLLNALASMMSDLSKHPDTKNYNKYIMALGLMYTQQRDVIGLRRWIEGFR